MANGRLRLAALAAFVVFAGLPVRWAIPVRAQDRDREVHRAGGDVTPPRLTFKVEPEYTEEAREAKLEGAVVLRVVVETDGWVREIEILRGLGMGLDENAIAAVRQWRFAPGKKDDEPVAVQATIEVNFRLPSKG